MAIAATNWFWFEADAVARLKEKIPDLAPRVFSSRDLSRMKEAEILPGASLYVVYTGDREGPKSNRQDLEVVAQRWAVAAVIRNVRALTRGDGARDDAGPILMDVVRALAGWRPQTAAFPVRRLGSPPVTYGNGFLYAAIVFEVLFSVSSGVDLDY